MRARSSVVEQHPFKVKVGGSSPPALTTKSRFLSKIGIFYSLKLLPQVSKCSLKMGDTMKFAKSFLLLFTFSIAFQSINAQITSVALLKTNAFLASKELAGRLPGSEGYLKAAKFMERNFADMKLKGIEKNNYYQKLKVEYNEILAPEHLAVLNNGKISEYKLGTDYVYRGFTGSGKLKASVVFCGYGLSQPELGYDDYSGIDVKGKVAIVFRYNPKWNISNKSFALGNPREKAIVAAKHGAIGILFVSFPNDAEPQKPLGSMIHGDGEQMQNFPEVHIELYVADNLFLGSGATLKELQTKIDALLKENAELKAAKQEFSSSKQSFNRMSLRLRKLCKRLEAKEEIVLEMRNIAEEIRALTRKATE